MLNKYREGGERVGDTVNGSHNNRLELMYAKNVWKDSYHPMSRFFNVITNVVRAVPSLMQQIRSISANGIVCRDETIEIVWRMGGDLKFIMEILGRQLESLRPLRGR